MRSLPVGEYRRSQASRVSTPCGCALGLHVVFDAASARVTLSQPFAGAAPHAPYAFHALPADAH
jgi:hypothetical protein